MDSGRPPQLKPLSIVKLLKLHYGFQQADEDSVKHLPSYYDVNFYFRGIPNQDALEGEYMLKILNRAHISNEIAVGLSALWAHLNKKGLNYTNMLPNIQGDRVTTLTVQELVQFEEEQPSEAVLSLAFSIRVMRFVPGEVFDAVDKRYLTPSLLFDVGAFTGRIDTALQVILPLICIIMNRCVTVSMQDGFHNSAIETRFNVWDAVHFPSIRKHFSLLDDPKKQEMVEKCLTGFENYVLPKISTFKKGIIYNDASGQNIILQKVASKDEYKVVGMIDFDETVYSSYVFDLSTSLAYIMMENLSPAGYPGPVEFIAPLVNGFTSVFPLSSEEKQSLYYLTLARCCLSAVFGELSFKAEPWNEYMLTTPRKSWKLIDLLLSAGNDYVHDVWDCL